MQNNEEKKKEENKVLEVERVNVIIPQCCREGWDNCPHSVKPFKKIKQNIGL